MSLTGGQPNFARCLAVSCAATLYIHFRRLLPPEIDRILPGAKFALRPSLAFSYIGSVLHGTPAAGVSQTLGRGTRNGITELSQRTPPIFGGTSITLGIGPHSSFILRCKISILNKYITLSLSIFADNCMLTIYLDTVT